MPRRPRNRLEASSKDIRAANETKVFRCAIYTRKSTSEGLDQAFNSLDAQREAAESYIASQKHAGWVVIPDRYDDGGFSGGNIERPGLQKLMEDINAGLIDCVVVYKVDRLSRSLLDFARIMKLFEDQGVHFVSVTQHFNTAESMGRLTLNILLSFAQFEREIIGERIRDKIAASRRKGKWPGGNLVLGYDLERIERKLLVNEAEAKQVNEIFRLYLEHESMLPVVHELRKRNWHTKAWIDRNGKPRGGREFDKWNLYLMLTNVIYLGKIKHKTELFEGEHPAIVDQALFDRVSKMLERNRRHRGALTRDKYGALLKGLLRCSHCDRSMIHCPVAKKGTKRYRYYVCLLAQRSGTISCPSGWVSAPRIESAVIDQLRLIRTQIPDRPTQQLIKRVCDDPDLQLNAKARSKLLREVVEAIYYDEKTEVIRIRMLERQATKPELVKA